MPEADFGERLERLERDNRRLKAFALAVLIVVAALAAMNAAQPVPDVIAAHKFLVEGHSGQVLIELAIGSSKVKNGGQVEWPAVALKDTAGNPTVALGGPDGASLAFWNSSGSETIELGSPFSTGPFLQLSGPHEKDALYMQVLPSGQPSVR